MRLPHHKIVSLILAGILLILLTGPRAIAQKANFEAAERFTTQMMEKMSGSPYLHPQWIEDQDRFWYSYEQTEGKNWYFVDAAKNSKRRLFDQEDMAAQLARIFNKPFDSKDLPLKEFKYDTGKGLFTFHVDSIKFKYKVQSEELIKGDTLEKEPKERWKTYSPDSTWIAYAKNHNLYVTKADTADTTEYQLTEDGEKWYSFQADEDDTTGNGIKSTSLKPTPPPAGWRCCSPRRANPTSIRGLPSLRCSTMTASISGSPNGRDGDNFTCMMNMVS